ncbi:MAG: hypothetical protein Q4C58_03165 [Eubacteriales bacterium]|nr:hypothetical protein [Eubacteriales bacterium]
MKKNKMMRIASGLLVLCLLTTCAISGTFAKYVTSESGSDSARVAKFGVEITANGSMFAKTYETDDQTVTGIANSVVSTENVIAPGTEGEMVGMALSGTPEVAVAVTYAVTKLDLTGWTDEEGNYYCPLEITVGNDTIKGLDYASAAEFSAAVSQKIAGYSKNYAPNTDLRTVSADSLSVSWAWPFYVSEGNDVKDTYLGDQAAEGNASKVEIEVTTTVTQID